MDLEGNEFPFTRGVSFYELDAEGRMRRGRDLLESPIKPGRPVLFVSVPASEVCKQIPGNLNCGGDS